MQRSLAVDRDQWFLAPTELPKTECHYHLLERASSALEEKVLVETNLENNLDNAHPPYELVSL